jgi:hypothetical protein
MAIPITILEIELLFSLLGTAYLWFGHDKFNYTELISGIIATLCWFLTAFSFLIGVATDGMLFVSTALFFVVLAIGIIVGLITIVKILDTLNSRGKDTIGSMQLDMKL